MKKIGFLSFGHWMRSAADALLQSIDLAIEPWMAVAGMLKEVRVEVRLLPEVMFAVGVVNVACAQHLLTL